MKKINVTKPSVPNIKLFDQYLRSLYKTRHLTTNGPLIKLLENKIKKILKVKYLCLVSSGTMALQIAYKTLNIKKGILTSPFSYIAAANAAEWINLNVEFCDISKKDLGIDINKIEKKYLKKFDCVVPVHSFGIPCNIKKIEKWCKKYKKKLIFDASHCFKISYKKKSIFSYGDASVLSLQATKVFNTCEGGAIIFKKKRDLEMAKRLIQIGYNYNFEKTKFPKKGINAKMSELNAAWGLALLKRINHVIQNKKKKYFLYVKYLKDIQNIKILFNKKGNFNYFPVLFKNSKLKIKAIKMLNKKNIFPREYFYPSLNHISHFQSKSSFGISNDIANKILCLPIFEDIYSHEIKSICKIIKKALNE